MNFDFAGPTVGFALIVTGEATGSLWATAAGVAMTAVTLWIRTATADARVEAGLAASTDFPSGWGLGLTRTADGRWEAYLVAADEVIAVHPDSWWDHLRGRRSWTTLRDARAAAYLRAAALKPAPPPPAVSR